MHDALVIGGGFAGVAAAAALRSRGLDVVILDDRATLGGRARSDVLGGVTIDTGAQLVASSFERAMRLLAAPAPAPHEGDAEAAPHAALVPAAGRDLFVHGAARHPIQFGSMRSLLSYGALGAGEKLRLGTSLLPLVRRHGTALDAGGATLPPELDGESARAFVERAIGARAADALVEPAVNAFYAATGSEISLAFFVMLGRYGSDSDLLAPAGGFSALLARAARGAAHVAGARIVALEARGDGVCARAEDGREWRARGAALATGARAARALLAGALADGAPGDAPILGWLDALDVRPTFTLAVAIDGEADRAAFGIFEHHAEARTVAACAVHGAKLGARAPAGLDVVLAWPTPAAAARLHARPAGEIADAMLPDVERLVPSARGRATHVRLYRAEAGTPLAHPGFVTQRAEGRALAEALAAGRGAPIALAGDYLATPTVEGAVASGERAAAALLRRLAPES